MQSHAINPVTSVVIPAMMANVEEVKVVVAHNERATLRVGDVFLKIDAGQTRTDVEAEAMAMAPVPTPEILWRRPPVLALAALPGTALGHLGKPSTASPAAWAAAGAAVRTLHDAPLPPWPGRSPGELASRLDGECEWLVANDVLPAGLVTRNRQLAETALRPWTPVFIHGDLQVDHVFVDGGEVTGVVDWSEASQGDALFDVAILTLGHQEHLGDVVAGYGTDVDRDLIRAWWSLRCLTNVRWLAEHGYGSPEEFPRSPCCDPGREAARARPLRAPVLPRSRGHLPKPGVFRTDEVMVLEDPGQPLGDLGSRRATRVEDAPQRHPVMADMQVIVRLQDRGVLRLDHLHDPALCEPEGRGDLLIIHIMPRTGSSAAARARQAEALVVPRVRSGAVDSVCCRPRLMGLVTDSSLSLHAAAPVAAVLHCTRGPFAGHFAAPEPGDPRIFSGRRRLAWRRMLGAVGAAVARLW